MSDQDDNLIVQIRTKEEDAKKELEHVQDENNKSIADANEDAEKLITDEEEATKSVGLQKLQEGKEKGKEEYKKIIIELDNERRDAIEGGKVNLDKAKKHINDSFHKFFS